MAPRRFPRPWAVDERPESFIIRDANSFPIAYVYFCDNGERRASMIERMSKDEARRIAVNMARLPDLLSPPRNDESPGAEAPGRAVDGG